MRVQIFCEDCMFERDFSKTDMPSCAVLPIQENGTYEFTCRIGHHNKVALVSPKYQILIEAAIQAILDGYYIEAIAAFMSGLERFFQYYCELVAIRRHGEDCTKITRLWRHVEKFSERQIGMFVATYFFETGNSPNILDSKSVAFRNKVIHQGFIPSRSEAIGFGQKIVDIIHPILWELTDNYREEISKDNIMRQRHAGDLYLNNGYRISRPIFLLHPGNYQKIAVNVQIEADQRGRTSPLISGMA